MNVNGYELTSEWKNSTCGKIAKAQKGGKYYFMKKYQTPVAPIDNGTLDAKTIAHNQKLFDEFVALRKRVNTSLRALAGTGGNIVIPVEEFIDGNQYVEASEFVEGAISKEELIPTIMSLSLAQKLLLMKTAAGALSGVHGRRIVHSDIKLQNLILVRNSAGNYVGKILDFDSSYPVDQKPEEIIGTIDYYSPELGTYVDAEDEDERKEMEKHITEKTDIFSLGLIFHFYLSGEFPEAVSLTERLQRRKDKGGVIYPWVALNSGCELKISPVIKGAKYISLITDMLSINPNDRPTASEILGRLQAPDPVAGEVILQETWPEHGIVLDKAKIAAADVIKLEKVIDESAHKYKALFADGRRRIMQKEDLISQGFAKVAAPDGFCAPLAEHNVEFDVDKIKSRGYVGSEHATIGGVRGYNFYRADSTSVFLKIETLLAMRYAKNKPKPVVVPAEVRATDPWPEHNVVFDMDVIRTKGYMSFTRKNMGGVNGYEFVRTNGTRQFIRIEMVIIQRMARKL